MMPKGPQRWMLLALGLAVGTGVFLMWLQPAVVRGLLDASISMWCS